jgi:hypothetical protein
VVVADLRYCNRRRKTPKSVSKKPVSAPRYENSTIEIPKRVTNNCTPTNSDSGVYIHFVGVNTFHSRSHPLLSATQAATTAQVCLSLGHSQLLGPPLFWV